MAQTYQELVDQVQTLIDRSDADTQLADSGNTVNWINEAIEIAETWFYRSAAARTPPFEKVVNHTVPAGSQSVALPTDYFEGRYGIATVGSQTRTMARVSPEQILNSNSSERVPIPERIAYGSNNWLFDRPASETTMSIYYYGKLANLNTVTASTTNHWLLNNASDLILYRAAYELSMYFGSIDDAMAQRWLQRADEIRIDIENQESRQRASMSTPRIGRHYRQPASRY